MSGAADLGVLGVGESIDAAYQKTRAGAKTLLEGDAVSLENANGETVNIVQGVSYFYRLFTAPYVYPPARRDAPTPSGSFLAKSLAVAIDETTNPILTAFGNGEWSDINPKVGNIEPYKFVPPVSASGGVNVYGAYKNDNVPPTTPGIVSRVSTPEDIAAAKAAGRQPYTFPEPALTPSNARILEELQAVYPGAFRADTAVRSEIACVSRFHTTKSYVEPVYVAALNVKSASNATITATLLINGGAGDTSLGLSGFMANDPINRSIAGVLTIGNAGVASGTMTGPGSHFAAADGSTNAIHVFEVTRSPKIATGTPVADVNQCVRRLVSTINLPSSSVEGGTCMISPNACSDNCGSIVVCVGKVQSGRVLDRRDAPVFSRAIVYARDSVEDGAVQYSVHAAPIDIDVKRTILQAGITRLGNVVGVVTADASDFTSNATLTMYVKNVKFIPPDTAGADASSQNRWIPVQTFAITNVVHPMIPIINNPHQAGETDEGYVVTFSGFNYYDASESGRFVAVVENMRSLKDVADASLPGTGLRAVAEESKRTNYIIGYHEFTPAPLPTPPSSLKFSAESTELSAPSYYNRDLSAAESDFFRKFAGHLDIAAAGGMLGGKWEPIAAGKEFRISIADETKMLFRGIDMTDSGLLVSARVVFVGGSVALVKSRTGRFAGALQGSFIQKISRTFVEAPSYYHIDSQRNRGPGSQTEVGENGVKTPGDAFLSNFIGLA